MLSLVSVEQNREYFVRRAADYIRQRENGLAKFIVDTENLRDATVDAMGTTLIHLAAADGNLEITNYLLELGANVDAQDQFGYTPLMKSLYDDPSEEVRLKYITVVETLLRSGANLLLKNNLFANALEMAFNLRTGNTTRRNLNIIQLFLDLVQNNCQNDSEMMANILMNNGCPLERVMLYNQPHLTKAMIARGCSVDQRLCATGTTALHAAVNLMSLGNVTALLEEGADVFAMDQRGLIPLQYYYKAGYYNEAARDNEEPEIVRIMMESIDDVNKRSLGRFIVETVAARGSERAVRVLLQYDLDFYAQNSFKKSLLYHFAGNPIPHVLNLLKTAKAYLTFRRTESSGLLVPAVMCSNKDSVHFLLENGADPNFTTGTDQTHVVIGALKTFVSRRGTIRSLECLALLLQNGASVQCEHRAPGGIKKTVFELNFNSQSVEKLLTQYLAIEEVSGKPIIDKIRENVKSKDTLQDLFTKCTQDLRTMNEENVYRSLTMFTLLSDNAESITRRYAYNSEFLEKLENLYVADREAESQLPFYQRLVNKRISKMISRIESILDAHEIVSYLISDKKKMDAIVVREIVNYLDYFDVQALKNLNLAIAE